MIDAHILAKLVLEVGTDRFGNVDFRSKPFTESMDPDELEALATSVMVPQPVTDKKGTVRWYWRGRLHREDGPAIEWANGSKEWYRNGLLHRDDGPAIEWASGDKWWFKDGLCHRDGGPAFEGANGDKEWYRNGQLHRDDGPAVEFADGTKEWYRNGVSVEPFTESESVTERLNSEIESDWEKKQADGWTFLKNRAKRAHRLGFTVRGAGEGTGVYKTRRKSGLNLVARESVDGVNVPALVQVILELDR